jgi:DNA-binding GntR family transcriptional regulator
MPLTEISLPRERPLAEELYDALLDSILDGTLKPNERLGEENVALLASVSRTPVREALTRLEARGLVESSSNGVVVVSFSNDELGDMLVVRECLEGLVSRLAAESATELDVLTLSRICDQWTEIQGRGDVRALVRLNHVFHESVWRAAGNHYLSDQLRVLRAQIEGRQPTTLGVPGRARKAGEDHRTLLKAIRAKDGDAAERIGREHFRQAMAIRLAMESQDAEVAVSLSVPRKRSPTARKPR